MEESTHHTAHVNTRNISSPTYSKTSISFFLPGSPVPTLTQAYGFQNDEEETNDTMKTLQNFLLQERIGDQELLC